MIAILGASGYLGSKFAEIMDRRALSWTGVARADLNYTDVAVLRDWLRTERPRYLINAAGYTGKPNVDACEDHKAFEFFESDGECMRLTTFASRSDCVTDSTKLVSADTERRPVEEAVRNSLCKMRSALQVERVSA